jgi:fructose-1,6-bisphosphatase-3
MSNFDKSDRKYLLELAKQYPSRNAAAAEIIRLNGLLNLPKGTEHFLSDLHGEADAFEHIMRSASGVIKNKIDVLFKSDTEDEERKNLASLIYYPEENLAILKKCDPAYSENAAKNAKRMIKVLLYL